MALISLALGETANVGAPSQYLQLVVSAPSGEEASIRAIILSKYMVLYLRREIWLPFFWSPFQQCSALSP